ncbi:MAG TPA: lipoprotein-releasing system ATP-binding protein LolD [Bacteroidales bacterium]|nr:MAG: lipoprotein ABC transporter ATP-binding protein [Bacteroidetes bacterium GWF2_33_38]OFY73891.1 MAG: lipoprotein ABC transporter ATP-binding protein [Bacteroidetes bacterium RIFOXYA12_FULL_33_9]HBF88387.1 lipoprotein-releasing system ATP-binding protein LolD [Bacteroidales bacterium]
MIKATNIFKSYGDLKVLNGIDIEIKQGEIVSIVGASGAGKTTLLQVLGTLTNFDSGKIEINDVEVSTMKEKQLSKFRNQNVGFVFQFHHLLPEFTALENVCIPAFIAKRNKKEAIEQAKELLNMLHLSNKFESKPNQLSGGEKQRIAIARALINNPSVILADEPTGNLDSKNSLELYDLIFSLREKFNQTFVIVTHNGRLADMTDNVFTMQDGKIIM